ncbi:phage virion morphogenesis protein [Undibacterium sp.]|uniref:phage virion morphogenesis protein n=1 Tax=Undibacterium sp. TaxID=1914977 RepID=UPI00272EF2B3|nr:phage virion morphogenesis protein [Undibacterium sp.]MDP1978287.1 phage virion morphogenesis protein [Undibacterium sp.]
MQDDLTALETWASTLLAKLAPAARRKLTNQVAQDLRRQQQTRIQAQQNPDGTPYAPRKQRKNIRDKQGRIKKQKASMFNKLRTNTHLKAKADGNGLEVGFYGRVARIARVHQYGLRDRVVAGGGDVQYEQRRVLGLNFEQDIYSFKILNNIFI